MQHDLIRLHHMLDAARDAINFATGKTRKDLDTDRILALAIVKSIEIIGEAASKLTEKFRSNNKGIPMGGYYKYASPVNSCIFRHQSGYRLANR
jgi:uncharacterized protein with HEPN domain